VTRREWRDLGLVLGVALALRLALWCLLPRELPISDEPEYLAAAGWLARGHGFSFYAEWPWLRPPLYLLFLAPFVGLFGFDLTPIRLVQIAVSLLVPALVYTLGRAALGRRVGLVAGLIAALWLPLAVLPHLVLAENLFLPLLLAACWCLVRFQQEPRPRWVLAGGALLGLATLTRGLTIGFVPLAALWVLVVGRRARPVGARRAVPLRDAVLFAIAALLVILPWSGYSSLRYGRLILVDTTGGYNFWLGTQGGQFHNLREVNRVLLELPDPASRQSYAYEQGFGAIAADPGGFLRNRITELGQLLHINYSADERLVDGFVMGEVPVPHLLVLFLLEDTLYVLLVPLALLGLFLRKGEAGRGLVLLWLGYNLLLAVAFFAIGRFRLPLLPFLAIYAAALVERPWRAVFARAGQAPGAPPPSPDAQRPQDGQPQGTALGGNKGSPFHWIRLAAAGLLVVAFWAVVLPSYVGPYPAASGSTLLGLQGRSAADSLARAEEAIAAGDLEQAREEIQRASSYRPDGVNPVASAQVVLAEWYRARGEEAAALAAVTGVDWYQARLLRGDLLRAQGELDEARAEFGARDVEARNPTAWAWAHLHPPAGREVDLGGGLDLGLVDGFYPGERDGELTYRWSGEEARLRFPGAGTGRPQTLRLRLRGWRPEGGTPAEVVLSVEGTEVARFVAPPGWEEVSVPLPATATGQDTVLTLRTTTFLPGPRDLLTTGKLRVLGVMVEGARLQN
jgi:4-amino-4-deoxy-L-arabinose transferase-like glycosyltransferase